MKLNRVLEQHIAVFGASGSGKTVLLSSFYGAAQEAGFLKDSLYKVSADDIGQGSRLHKNYLGMRDSAERPEPTRFAATSYSFTIKIEGSSATAARSKPFDSLRLVWHDYPGEWFEQDVSGPVEAQRRVDTFRALLVSDVAVLLVDGQRLLDHSGEEEKYLKSVLHDFRAGLENLKTGVLHDGKLLHEFPRIWVLALSKADLLPDYDVFKFRDLLVLKAADDLDELRKTITGFVESGAALSVGEDFMLLSSAEFGAERIEVSKRIGVNLMLPVSAILPLERYVRWVKAKKIAGKVADTLLEQAGPLAVALLTRVKLPGPIGALVGTALTLLLRKFQREVEEAAEVSGDKLKRLYHDALDRQDNVQAVLANFKLELERGEENRTLLRSQA